MSDEQGREDRQSTTKLEERLERMDADDLRAEVLRMHRETRGLNRKISELDRELGKTPEREKEEGERRREELENRLRVREGILDEAARRNLPLGLVRRLHVEDVDEIPNVLDEMENALKDRQAAENRAFDRAHGRKVVSPPKEYGVGSYQDLLRMDNDALNHMSPGAVDHVMERELKQGGNR